jgi:hypothetical protein
MVVVLMVIARTPTAAEAAAAWGGRGREANMVKIVKDAGLALAYKGGSAVLFFHSTPNSVRR